MKHALTILTALLLASPSVVHAAASQKKPNVVVILVDDMGYGDIAAHGNPVIRTPQLDRLHAESARLTDFHRDPETFLHASDWYLPNPPWNHGAVAGGPPASGDWQIRAARSGVYRFEVRRWPREADAELGGVPAIHKTVDSWDAQGPKPDLLYGGAPSKFKQLPVTSVRLTVGEKTQILPAAKGAKEVSFDLELVTGCSYAVKAELLDRSGAVIAGGYYVYCRMQAAPEDRNK